MGARHRATTKALRIRISAFLRSYTSWLLGVIVCAACSTAAAQLEVQNTRVVFTAGSKSVEFALSNASKEQQTIQAWIDSGDAQIAPDDAQAPFFVTPPVSKIRPGGKQILRISFTGDTFATGQESLYYLNILNLAPVPVVADGQNAMRFHTRSRFKVLFRPPGLPGNPAQAAQQVGWRLDAQGNGHGLTANNPSPYFLSLVNIRLLRGQHAIQALESSTVAPHSNASFQLRDPGSDAGAATSVEYQYIDDDGLYRDCSFAFKTAE